MLSAYSSCNIHLILKTFIGLVYVRVVPLVTLDPTAEQHICNYQFKCVCC